MCPLLFSAVLVACFCVLVAACVVQRRPNRRQNPVFFLTGPPKTGKSYLLKMLSTRLKWVGITTPEISADGERLAIGLKDHLGNDGILAARRHADDRFNHGTTFGSWVVYPSELERISGTAFVPAKDTQVMLIDELGKMELFSRSFVDRVDAILACPIVPVIVTVPCSEVPAEISAIIARTCAVGNGRRIFLNADRSNFAEVLEMLYHACK